MRIGSLSSRFMAFLQHPFMTFFVGLVLVLSGLDDLLQEWGLDAVIGLGVHHGVIIYGLHKALLALGDVVDGGQKALGGYRRRARAGTEPNVAAAAEEA